MYYPKYPINTEEDFQTSLISPRKVVIKWPTPPEQENIDRDTYGEWAIFGDPKWRYGPAAKKIGYNLEGYVELFKEIEEELGIEVAERIGDSRYFARENETNDDLFTAFYDFGMNFIPSDGRPEDQGITALDEWFSYNPNVEIDEANQTMCYIHNDCGHSIDPLINYNSTGKSDEPLKDFFDVLRYLRMAKAVGGQEHTDYTATKALTYTILANYT